MAIAVFFIAHYVSTIFCQTFFHHRYAAHRMFTMSRGWEKFFYVLTFVCQGSSFLVPRAYAILHRMHHAYSDTPQDPHSPRHSGNVGTMMWRTAVLYNAIASREAEVEPRFLGDLPEMPGLDRVSQGWPSRLAWGALYTLFYIEFATEWWQFLLLPIHYLMGPLHGAIVNWCGHRYGYRTFATDDVSRNTLPFDMLTMGELFQNNHHKYPMAPNFAARWFEIDPAYLVIRAFAAFKIITMRPNTQVMRYTLTT